MVTRAAHRHRNIQVYGTRHTVQPRRRQAFAPHIDGTGAGTVCHQYGDLRYTVHVITHVISTK